jgi:hypothetical protein
MCLYPTELLLTLNKVSSWPLLLPIQHRRLQSLKLGCVMLQAIQTSA